MKKIKILALILALFTLASTFVSCAKNEDEIRSDTSDDLVVSTESSDTDDVLDVEDDLPETMDFGGRVFNILARVEGNIDNNLLGNGFSNGKVKGT